VVSCLVVKVVEQACTPWAQPGTATKFCVAADHTLEAHSDDVVNESIQQDPIKNVWTGASWISLLEQYELSAWVMNVYPRIRLR
jgi:hypothetical protein